VNHALLQFGYEAQCKASLLCEFSDGVLRLKSQRDRFLHRYARIIWVFLPRQFMIDWPYSNELADCLLILELSRIFSTGG